MAEQNGNQVEIQHEPTIFAEPVFEIGKFSVTNSLLNSSLTVLILALFFVAAGKKAARIPKGIQNFFEMILGGALSFADSVTGNRKKSELYMPLILGLFLFILVNNWLGLFPGVGTIGFIESHEGHPIFIPLFRGGTADLNTTLALALFSVISVHVFGAATVGAWTHLNKFINVKTILRIPKDFAKDKNAIFINPIKAFVGVVEIIGEMAKVASLSLRLFGNIFAGEVLIASMMALFAFALPLPFMFLEILVGVIQASVFAILVLVFLSMFSVAEEH